MLSDFSFITWNFPDRQDIKVVGVSDTHIGAAEHLEREWNDFLADVLKDENLYVILGGDLINNSTRSSIANIFEEKMRPREQKKRMVEMLAPLADKKRILCILPGNHEDRSVKDADDNPMYDIACKLDLEDIYRENLAFLRLRFGNNRSDGAHNPTYIFVVTHGAGGGILTGGAVNRAERFGYVFDGADAIWVGHTHKPFTTQPAKIKIDSNSNTISIKPFKVISMTSWLSYGGYAAKKMLTPTSFDPQIVYVAGNHKELKVLS